MYKSMAASLSVLLAVSCGGISKPSTDTTADTAGNNGIKNGAINPDVTQENINITICKAGWTKTIRPSSTYTNRIKARMMREQNWPSGERAILDHYIPLQGGGHPTDPRNFILQKVKVSYEKDNAEDDMRDDICDGKKTLIEAQREMSLGWENYRAAQ